ncbi:MAG: SIS domain-containing protein [Chloroflexi bacterium]|nr:SIS domain-containing protein [Chloroflexota bacterium]
MADLSRTVQDYVASVRQCLDELQPADLAAVVELLYSVYQQQGQVLLVGNGGSASTASHFATHLQEGTDGKGKAGVRAFCLSDNTSRLTAVANDVDYASVFANQAAALLQSGDALIAISGSGESANVLKAARLAREMGVKVIALAGFGGGTLSRLADCAVVLSSRRYGPVEDVHLSLAHLIPQMLRERIQDAQTSRVS